MGPGRLGERRDGRLRPLVRLGGRCHVASRRRLAGCSPLGRRAVPAARPGYDCGDEWLGSRRFVSARPHEPAGRCPPAGFSVRSKLGAQASVRRVRLFGDFDPHCPALRIRPQRSRTAHLEHTRALDPVHGHRDLGLAFEIGDAILSRGSFTRAGGDGAFQCRACRNRAFQCRACRYHACQCRVCVGGSTARRRQPVFRDRRWWESNPAFAKRRHVEQ